MSETPIKAKIIRSHQREFDCLIEGSPETVKATALGNLLKKGETLVVGDNVYLEIIPETNEYIIKEAMPRKNEIFRILVRESKRKVTAANCDYLVILSSAARPRFKRGIIDRFLVRAFQWGVEPIIVFNKMDNYDPEEFDIQYEILRLKSLGIQYFEICALDKDYETQYLKGGMQEFKDALQGKTALFVGQSGVGKSQTISCLSNGEVELKTKQVGKIGKGSHTTTWSEIVDLGDFYLIDSPGIRSFSLDDIDPDDLIEYFPDLKEISRSCQFSNCTHEPENKGCAFYSEEFDPETEEGLMVHSRLDSYQLIYSETSSTPFWQKKKKYN